MSEYFSSQHKLIKGSIREKVYTKIKENPGITRCELVKQFFGENYTDKQRKKIYSTVCKLKSFDIVKVEGEKVEIISDNSIIKPFSEFVIKKKLTDRQRNLMNYFKMKEINGITETDENVYIDPVPMISSLVRKVVEQKSANYQMQTSNGEIKPVVDIDSFSTFIQSFMEELDDLAADY